MLSFYIVSVFSLVILILSGCGKGNKKPNVDDIIISVEVQRFDLDARENLIGKKPVEVSAMKKSYPEFFPIFSGQILEIGEITDSSYTEEDALTDYFNDPYVIELYDSVATHFPDLNEFEKQMEQSLRYVKFYFPEKPTPKLISFISNFTYAAITVDTSVLAVALDMYLDTGFKYYKSMFPQFIYEKFKPEYMAANSLKTLALEYFPYQMKGNTLLDRMIDNGRLIYFAEMTCDECEDYQLIGMNEEDEIWCEENEPEIWNFLIEHDLVYSTQQGEFNKYIEDGPNTSGMPVEAPGNVGSWIGWQIVRQYMERNNEVTLDELMKADDAEMILQMARYKPRN